MARQIQVLYSYTGDDTQWEYIKPGIYDEGDSALFGLADKLLENKIAQVYAGAKEETPMVESSDETPTVETPTESVPEFSKPVYSPRRNKDSEVPDFTSGGRLTDE